MAGLEMIQMSPRVPVNKGTAQRTGRQDKDVTGFGDMLREKEALEDGQHCEKDPVSSESPSSERAEKKNTNRQDEESSLIEESSLTENSIAEAQLNMLLTEVLMKLQPVMARQPGTTDQEGKTEPGNTVTEVSGDAKQVFPAAVTTEIMGNTVPESAGDMQSGDMQFRDMQSGNMQSGNIQSGDIQSGNMQSGSPSGDTRDVTALRESASREQYETGAANQNQQQVWEEDGKEPEETKKPLHEEAAAAGKGMETSAEKIPYHMEGDVIHNQSMDKHALFPQHQPAETLKTSPDTLPRDVAHMLGTRLPAGDGTMVIELEPAALGKLTIEVIYEEGKAAVSILASNPKTLELLSRNLSDIAYILEEKTGQETVIYTQHTEQQPSYNQQQEESRQDKRDSGEEKKEQHADSFAQQLRLGLV